MCPRVYRKYTTIQTSQQANKCFLDHVDTLLQILFQFICHFGFLSCIFVFVFFTTSPLAAIMKDLLLTILQSVELTCESLEFLKRVFNLFDIDNVCIDLCYILTHSDVIYRFSVSTNVQVLRWFFY